MGEATLGTVVVVGGGCIGAFVAGKLALSGQDVRVLTTSSRTSTALRDAVCDSGLRLIDTVRGTTDTVPAAKCQASWTTDTSILAAADLVLVATKRQANPGVGKSLQEHAKPGVGVVLLQNGMDPARDLLSLGLDIKATSAVVMMNVISDATSGAFSLCSPLRRLIFPREAVERVSPALPAALAQAGFDVKTIRDEDYLKERWIPNSLHREPSLAPSHPLPCLTESCTLRPSTGEASLS